MSDNDRCEPGTGWPYCHHADEGLTVCRCSCTCLDQRHCPYDPFRMADISQVAQTDMEKS